MTKDRDYRVGWRRTIQKLSNEDLVDELRRPTMDWEQDILRESIIRLLEVKIGIPSRILEGMARVEEIKEEIRKTRKK